MHDAILSKLMCCDIYHILLALVMILPPIFISCKAKFTDIVPQI